MADEVDPERQLVLGLHATGLVEVEARPIKLPSIVIDTSSHFQTERKEKDRDELIEWAREVGKKLKFGIIVRRSDYGGDKRKMFFVLECERGGNYVPTNKKLKSDQTGTRKCGCPFRLRGYYSSATNLWSLTVVNGTHNHELDKGAEGHLVVGRLKPKEREFLDEMSRNLVAPRNIISTLKDRDPENKTSAKQIYNHRHRYRLKSRASRTEMQHLFKHLDDHNYFFKHRSVAENGGEHLQDLFFAHPRSVSLFNSFSTVLMMGSTYKTNKYTMPLFEIVGFTSTERTFNVGFAWISNEKEDNFIWALQQVRLLLRREDNMPKVIITDRDTTLMNAVAQVFPTSAPLVCRFHVEKNVSSRFKELAKIKNGDGEKASVVYDRVGLAFKTLPNTHHPYSLANEQGQQHLSSIHGQSTNPGSTGRKQHRSSNYSCC